MSLALSAMIQDSIKRVLPQCFKQLHAPTHATLINEPFIQPKVELLLDSEGF